MITDLHLKLSKSKRRWLSHDFWRGFYQWSCNFPHV